MATITQAARPDVVPGVVLQDVPYDLYSALRDTRNSATRMTYHEGTLYLMAPEFLHESTAQRLSLIVRAVAEVCRIPLLGCGSTTFRRRASSPWRGSGKEPDASFYLAHAREMLIRPGIDLDFDPPPDLAIEVDHTSDSSIKLAVYAALRVPEVWRFEIATGTLWMGGLNDEGSYRELEASLSLPILTPACVAELLETGRSLDDSAWGPVLRAWARGMIGERGDEQ
jgi:Uma2 family endonuclease